MEYVRLFHPNHFDSRLGRFKSSAFKNSSNGGGASIFELDCGIKISGDVCSHIKRFYPNVGGDPAVYWVFEADELPQGSSLEAAPSNTGDLCHRNIKNVSDTYLRSIVIKLKTTNFMICDAAGTRSLRAEDLIR